MSLEAFEECLLKLTIIYSTVNMLKFIIFIREKCLMTGGFLIHDDLKLTLQLQLLGNACLWVEDH